MLQYIISGHASTKKKKRSRSRARQKKRRRRRTVQRRRSGPSSLPGWKDLPREKKEKGRIAGLSTARFALILFALAAAVTLYVGHVQATQSLLVSVQQERSENQHLHLKLERLRGEFNRATGPAVVYERAARLGLEERIDYGPTIRIEK